MDCIVLGVEKSQTRLSSTFTVVYPRPTTRFQNFAGEGATVAFKLNKGQQKTARRLHLLKPNIFICIPQ